MATQHNFRIKNGLEVAGVQRISSAGVITGTLDSNTTATTQSALDNSTKIATTAYTDAAITAVIGGAPGTLDTLNELAAAINDDDSYATTLTTALAGKLSLSGGTLTGNVTLNKTSGDALFKIVTGGGNDAILELDAPGAGGAQSFIKFSDSGTLAGSIIYTHNSGGTDYMTFGTGGNNTTALTIDSSQRVGIGTTNPSTLLNVNTPSSGSHDAIIISRTTHGTVGTFKNAAGALEITSNKQLLLGADPTNSFTAAGSEILFQTDGTTKMTLSSAGQLAIGQAPISTNNMGDVKFQLGNNYAFGGVYSAFGEILSSQSTIVGNNIRPVIGANNQVMRHYNGNDAGNFMKLTYSTGVTFHTGITTTQGTGISEDTNERMRIDTSGRVGIGTTSPQSYYSKNLVVLTDGDDTGGITLISPATDDTAYICFADGTSGAARYAGYLGYSHNDEKAFIGIGGSTKMTILSNGRTAIGGNHTPTKFLHVKGAFNATGAIGATFENTDTNGSSWLQLAGNGTAGSFQIGASGGNFRLYNDTTSAHILDISSTGALLAGVGTVSLPGISFISDSNSGLYQPAADQVGVVAGGSRKLLLTATDAYFQNLSGNINSGSNVIVTKSSAKLEATESGGASVRMIAGGSTGYIGNYSNHELQFMTNSTKRFSVSNAGSVVMDYFLGVRTATQSNGNAFAYSLTIQADNGGNAIEIFRTASSRMTQYMSADGKYYFDMNGSATPEIRFRSAGTDWMRTQGTRLFVGGSSTQTLGAGGSAAGGAANQTIVQVQGAVDMGYQGRYTHGLWGPATVASSGRYTHLKTAMWGGGSPHGNAEYIMGGFLITGYRYQSNANHRMLHQFHNWSGTLYNYSASDLLAANYWAGGSGGASHVYVASDGHVTIRLDSQSSAYRMFYVEYIQYSQYNKVSAEILSATVSNSATI